jgi:NAD(P)-dependent dehydrogenase (short-subunit alcohol dehydrogenase family)
MYPELNPYVVLITGGASGLGLAGAQAFAREGATVVIVDINESDAKQAASTLGEKHIGLVCDVADETQVNHAVDTVMKKLGRIDVLINCAGIADQVKPTVEQDMAHFRRLLDIHLTGSYMMTKACATVMLKQGKGNVINISSIAGVIGLTYRNAYSAAKAGISMLTRTLGCEWAAKGIRVNAIAPGYILTPLTQSLIDKGRLDKSIVERRTPMGRFGTPTHIADAMLFLASDQAAFITGVTLPVDGGYMSWGAPSDAFDDHS